MRKLALGLAVLVCVAWTCAAQARPAPVKQVFLVQNSGWMEPFYRDPRSRFRELLTALVAQSNLRGVEVALASFNQDGQVAGETSPKLLWSGPYDPAAVAQAVAALDLPRKPGGAYADADFHGALLGAISRLLGGGEGVIWMVTNNKDSPDNSQDVVANTQRFYALLRTSPHITRIAAFPIRDNLAGPHFQERGFIVYAFAYGPRAAKAFDAILADGAPVRAIFASPPVRLKPLDQAPVELRLTARPNQEGVRASIRDGALSLDHAPGGRATTVVLHGVLRNTYYPQNIDYAALAADFESRDPALAGARVTIAPAALEHIPARGDSAPVTLTLSLPAVPRRGPLFGWLDNDRALSGTLRIRLSGIRFSLDQGFVDRIAAISGAGEIRQAQAEAMVSAQLPAVFLDYKRISDAATDVPVAIALHYSPWPLILLLAGLAALIGGGGFLAFWAGRARAYPVSVGGSSQTVSLRPFEHRVVSDGFGVRARASGALFGPPRIQLLDDSAKTDN